MIAFLPLLLLAPPDIQAPLPVTRLDRDQMKRALDVTPNAPRELRPRTLDYQTRAELRHSLRRTLDAKRGAFEAAVTDWERFRTFERM